jgi:predicted RNA binding protein YcfA (HicA-like mRNA interferase family)
MSTWPSTKAKRVYRALLKIGWKPKRTDKKGSSHVQLIHPERGEYTWAWHDAVELGPVVLKKIAKQTGLTPDDL